MKKNLYLWQFAGLSVTSVGGTLLHFLYEISGGNVLSAAFSAVNESTWEHMKLLYFPMLIFALVQCRFFNEYRGFWSIKLVGISVGLALIPVLFYTYNGAFGKSPDLLNILFFYIAATAAYAIESYLFKKNALAFGAKFAFVPVCFIGALFVLFTFSPPRLPIFQDPISGAYGVWGE